MSIMTAIDQGVLERILESVDVSKMSAMQVVQLVFERTAMTYKLQWLESEAQCDKLTDTVVAKNMEINRLNGEIAKLTDAKELLDVRDNKA